MKQNQHPLNGIRCYTIGAIEAVSDKVATEWRDVVYSTLTAWGIEVFDPTKKDALIGLNEVGTERQYIQKLKKDDKWVEFNEVFKRIMHVDLRFTDRSDFLIAHIPKDVQVFGSVHEIVVARQQKKKVLVFTECPKHEVNSWLLRLVGHKNVFFGLDDIFTHLKTLTKLELMYNLDKEQ